MSETNEIARIAYRRQGEGEAAILFVHGFGCGFDDWKFQIESLSDEFTCVALDLPGHGNSAKAAAPIIPALAAAVNAVKAEIGANRVVLVGHSLGTKIVREAYRQSPENIAGIVFVDGSLNIGDAEAQRAKAREAVRGGGFDGFVERMFREMFVDTSDPATIESIVTRALRVDPQYAQDLYVEAGAWDSEKGLEQLRQLAVPKLVLQSTYYNIDLRRVSLKPGVSTPLMEAVAKEVKNDEIKVLENAGHFAMLDAPDAVNREIAAFARRV